MFPQIVQVGKSALTSTKIWALQLNNANKDKYFGQMHKNKNNKCIMQGEKNNKQANFEAEK